MFSSLLGSFLCSRPRDKLLKSQLKYSPEGTSQAVHTASTSCMTLLLQHVFSKLTGLHAKLSPAGEAWDCVYLAVFACLGTRSQDTLLLQRQSTSLGWSSFCPSSRNGLGRASGQKRFDWHGGLKRGPVPTALKGCGIRKKRGGPSRRRGCQLCGRIRAWLWAISTFSGVTRPLKHLSSPEIRAFNWLCSTPRRSDPQT